MKVTPPGASGKGRPAFTCNVVAYALAQASVDSLTVLRSELPPPGCGPLSPAFLKHLDEQTLVALVAVARALRASGMTATDCQEWGVVAASHFLGRSACAGALVRFQSEGAWGVSPHLIPHRSLHSVSGAISQMLTLHGPNFGAGGGPGTIMEGLLAGVGLLAEGRDPGVWLVFTGWDAEWPLASDGSLPGTGRVSAFVLGLAREVTGKPRMLFVPGTSATHETLSLTGLDTLIRSFSFSSTQGPRVSAVWDMPGGGRLELEGNMAVPSSKVEEDSRGDLAFAPSAPGTENES